jgi:hypothetical protein
MRYACLLFLSAIILIACASATGTKSPRRSTNVITAEEIASSTARDALEVVDLLRPQWLRTRGGPYLPIVYLNNAKYGEIDALREIPAANVAEVRYLSANEATTLYGTGHIGGAIAVKLK